jgi:UDP-N-acetylmuramoylalanine-D-glutamate ligase
VRISQLEGKRVALWGWGREGRAAFHVLQERLPGLALTLFCPEAEAATARAEAGAALRVRSDVSGDALAAFEVVIKSPGISPHGEAAAYATGQGTQFIGGTSLWFAEHADAEGTVRDTVCVTGTKGKSTTTSLLAHLLRASGARAGLVGNIGLPLLEVLAPAPAPA